MPAAVLAAAILGALLIPRQAAAPMQTALDFRSRLLEAAQCQFLAEITVEQEQRVYTFSGQCSYILDRSAEITLTQPEILSGLKAAWTPEQGRMEFEDVSLEIGPVAGGLLSPAELPLLLGRCWTEAYIASCGKDGDRTLVTYTSGYDSQQLTVNTWLDDGGAPVFCEVLRDGQLVLRAQLREFAL